MSNMPKRQNFPTPGQPVMVGPFFLSEAGHGRAEALVERCLLGRCSHGDDTNNGSDREAEQGGGCEVAQVWFEAAHLVHPVSRDLYSQEVDELLRVPRAARANLFVGGKLSFSGHSASTGRRYLALSRCFNFEERLRLSFIKSHH